jgi:hypothetical protein
MAPDEPMDTEHTDVYTVCLCLAGAHRPSP